MNEATAWRTDEPCSVCGSALTLLDDGGPVLAYECRLCGWSESWQPEISGGGGR